MAETGIKRLSPHPPPPRTPAAALVPLPEIPSGEFGRSTSDWWPGPSGRSTVGGPQRTTSQVTAHPLKGLPVEGAISAQYWYSPSGIATSVESNS